MKATYTSLALVAALMVLFAAVSHVSADGVCGMTQGELMECKKAAPAGVKNPPLPSKPCCDALAHANLPCICSFKDNQYYAKLLGVDPTRALLLPSLCADSTATPKPIDCPAH